ncbi:MAG: ATP-binding cassette domain-containing protein [Micrococcaceae bacterium]
MLDSLSPAAVTALSVSSLRVNISGAAVLDGIDLSISPGERVAVLGANGAGKSSLLRSLLGLIPAQWRGFTIEGLPVTSVASHRQARRRVAWVPQSPAFGDFPVTARDLFDLANARAEAVEVSRQLGVGKLIDVPVQEVSGGQLQRLLLSRAFGQLTGSGGLLLADEPSTGLDSRSLDLLHALLSESSAAALVVTHDERLLSACHRVIRVESGRLVNV